MIFQWDPRKAEKNLLKHGVSFELAATVFDDPFHLSVVDPASSFREERWVTVGSAMNRRVVLVVHMYRTFGPDGELIRIISARPATRKERRIYEKGI